MSEESECCGASRYTVAITATRPDGPPFVEVNGVRYVPESAVRQAAEAMRARAALAVCGADVLIGGHLAEALARRLLELPLPGDDQYKGDL